jgi:hypothetical protein
MKAWTLVTTRGVRAARLMHKVPGRPESAPTLAWLSSRRAHPPERGTSVSSDRDEGPLPDLLQTPGAAASLWRTAGLRRPSVVRTLLSAPRSRASALDRSPGLARTRRRGSGQPRAAHHIRPEIAHTSPIEPDDVPEGPKPSRSTPRAVTWPCECCCEKCCECCCELPERADPSV